MKSSNHFFCVFLLLTSFLTGCGDKGSKSYSQPSYQIPTTEPTPFPEVAEGEKFQLKNGDYIMNMGGGNYLNLRTGDYIMNMGGGDSMNTRNGDYIMNMGGGDSINLRTGAYIMDMGGGDKMVIGGDE
jgi:hypothetical protein